MASIFQKISLTSIGIFRKGFASILKIHRKLEDKNLRISFFSTKKWCNKWQRSFTFQNAPWDKFICPSAWVATKPLLRWAGKQIVFMIAYIIYNNIQLLPICVYLYKMYIYMCYICTIYYIHTVYICRYINYVLYICFIYNR